MATASAATKYSEISDDEGGLEGEEEQRPLHHSARANIIQRGKRKLAAPTTPSTICLLSYCLVALATITILLSIALLQKRNRDSVKCVNELSFEGQYGKDYELQSVSHEFDHHWESMTGESSLIDVPDPRLGGELMEASISMFHQLHCLTSFRHAIQMAHDGKDPGLDYHDNAHWPHCMDYLRKTILCWADGTVERYPLLPNGTWIRFIDGTADTRKCGDSKRLVQRMKDFGNENVPDPFPD